MIFNYSTGCFKWGDDDFFIWYSILNFRKLHFFFFIKHFLYKFLFIIQMESKKIVMLFFKFYLILLLLILNLFLYWTNFDFYSSAVNIFKFVNLLFVIRIYIFVNKFHSQICESWQDLWLVNQLRFLCFISFNKIFTIYIRSDLSIILILDWSFQFFFLIKIHSIWNKLCRINFYFELAINSFSFFYYSHNIFRISV
jgi:hypothetical protein